MLKSLTLLNFQIHEKETIELGPITVIVGPTDHGKSAFIRALKWLALNKPPSGTYINYNAKGCKVRLEVDNQDISRTKSSTVNSYTLDDQIFNAVNKNVPPEVEKLLNINEANFQHQLDSPFWFMETPGELGRALNKIVNLELIDTTMYNIGVMVRKAQADKKTADGQLEAAKIKKKELAWVLDADINLAKLELHDHDIAIKKTNNSVLSDLLNQAALAQKQRLSALAQQKSLAKIVETGTAITAKTARVNDLSQLIQKFKQARRDSQLGVPDCDKLYTLVDQILIKRTKINLLSDLITDHIKQESVICQNLKLVKDGRIELQEKTGGLCPICQQPLKKIS